MGGDHAIAASTICPTPASRLAETIMPIIAALQKSGITSLRGIAIALNGRGVRTTRGGAWQVSNVRNLLVRTKAA
jgi:hypothetical protein